MNQTVWPLAVPLYKGRRTVSLERSTWSALSRTRFFVGSRPVSCPSPLAAPGLSSALTGGGPYPAIPTEATATTRENEANNLGLPPRLIQGNPIFRFSLGAPANRDHR